MKRFFMSLLAIFFPWIILLSNDNPGGALLALIMQASVIGWIPASMWAFQILGKTKKTKEETKSNKKLEEK